MPYKLPLVCPEHYARILWRDIGHKALCPISPPSTSPCTCNWTFQCYKSLVLTSTTTVARAGAVGAAVGGAAPVAAAGVVGTTGWGDAAAGAGA